MMISRRSTIKTLGVVGAGSTLTGTALAVNEHEDDERDPEDAPDDDVDVGAIRVAHFGPDAPAVDVYVDEDQVLADVAYSELSPYLEIEPGTYTIMITAAGDPETVVYEENVPVDANYYTAAAIGELGGDAAGYEAEDAYDEDEGDYDDYDEHEDDYDDDYDEHEDDYDDDEMLDVGTFDVLFLVDNEPENVQEDTAEIRVVHASPDAPAVDIADGETGATVFEDLEFSIPSGYTPVDPGERTLELFPADNDADGDDDAEPDEDDLIAPPDPVAAVDVDLEEGVPYTAYAIGYLDTEDLADDPDDRSFEIVLTTDGTMDADDDLEAEEDELEPEDGSEAEDDTYADDADEPERDDGDEAYDDGGDEDADGDGYDPVEA
ncbi:DUF4397 domain-containing protein [Salinadaptatus halalkaliphilus]|uniref:DUF4397 domain-containing protein n=1 Tax=Salinadaptatus halalkaliphilus TaxID=2419781 RepID=A0A4V3VLL1_9EURY|nr:DUF4397 domain-containing protein [Salinadaptatus halalkaliphilus]THE66087.1 DUF4397 domain-containing protein [Salinadaptatus halalkaliphilus]